MYEVENMIIRTEIELYCPKGHKYPKDYFPNTSIMYCCKCNNNYYYNSSKKKGVIHKDIKWIKVDDVIVLKDKLKNKFINVKGNFSSSKIIDKVFEELE